MKPVLLVSEFFPPDPGGIQRSLSLLEAAWGAEVEVITPVHQKIYPGLQRSLFSGQLRPRWLWLIGAFWRRARGGRRLIVFGHYSAAVMAAWLLRPVGVQYVVLVHGNDVLVEQQRWMRWFIGRHLRSAAWVGVNSTWLAKKIHSLGVVESKIIRTHPAVADSEIIPSVKETNGQMILTIARLVARKNIITVLSGMVDIVKKIPTVQYHIVGDGPERALLQQYTEELGLQQHVIWHGQTSEATRRELLLRADLFVLIPTVRQHGSDVEGLGAVYLEAMAAGLPLVASATGGVTDTVHHQHNGLIVDPTDAHQLSEAVTTILGNPELRKKYGQAGRALVAEEFRSGVRTNRARHEVQGWPTAEQPKISIIIPAFNSTKSIRDTLASVWKQTWKHIEVIVVDDGSTDQLEQVLASERAKITIITQPNAGAPAARNRGAASATGHWWLFLDADTVLQPDALMTMAIVLENHPEAAYAYSDFRFGPKRFRLHDFSGQDLRRINYIHTSSLLRPSAWPGFDPDLKRFQDWDLWLTMLANGHRGMWIPRELFRVADTGNMSRWLPSFMYRLPFIGQGVGNDNIKRYREAEAIIKKKHKL